MRDIAELGIRPHRENPHPPVTQIELANFERHFGVKLPADFAFFLQFANGGRPTLSVCDDPNGGVAGMDEIYGLGSKLADDEAAARGSWDLGNLWGETRIWRPILGVFAVPFARDGGDNQFYLDTGQAKGMVNRLIAATRQTYQVSPSFESFIDMLRLPTTIEKRERKTRIPRV